MNLQSSRPHFPTILQFLIKRKITSGPLIMIKVKLMVKISGARVGGLRKFDGSSLGLSAKEVLDGSTLGGRDAIAAVITQKGEERFAPRGGEMDINASLFYQH